VNHEPQTIADVISGHEAEVEAIVHDAVAKSLADLGADIYKLEWANKAVAAEALAAA